MKKSVKKTKKNFLSTIKPKKKNLVYWILGVVVVIVLFYLISGSINISVKDKETGELKKESLRGMLFSLGNDDEAPAGSEEDVQCYSDSFCASTYPDRPYCDFQYGDHGYCTENPMIDYNYESPAG